MKKLLTTLTLLITLYSFAFGQNNYYFEKPNIGYNSSMIVYSLVYVDDVLQTDQTIEIAAFINGKVHGVCKDIYNDPNFPEPFNEYRYRKITIDGDADADNGKEIIFKAYDHDTGVELSFDNASEDIVYVTNGTIWPNNPLKLYFATPEPSQPVAKVGATEYSNIDDAIANWTAGTTLTLLDNVTLSDVITLKSTEHHILDLSTFTMTAASGKDAIQIENCGRTSASYALDIKADTENEGGITATGKAIVRTTGKSGVKDRPIIRFYNGTFNATNIVYHSGSNGTNCPQFYFYGGEFYGTIYTNRALNQFYGGTFHGNLQMSVDSSAYTLVAGGRFKSLSNLYMSSLNSDKFTIGSEKGTFDRGIYVDDEGYYVVGGPVITEAGETFEASIEKKFGTNDYFTYSSAATYGMYYTDALLCLKNNSNSTVNIYTDHLDLTSLNYKGTINISNKLVVTFNEGTTPAWTVANKDGYTVEYTDATENGVVTRTYTVITPIAQNKETEEYFYTLAEAVAVATGGQTITLLRDAEGNGIVIDKSLTIDFNTFTYTFNGNPVGSQGTESNGFQILKDNNITLKNGKLNVAESAKAQFYMLIQNYSNLTVENMELDGTNLDKYSTSTNPNDGDSYVLSNNSGNVIVSGNTSIIANNESTANPSKAFAFDACDQTSKDYALPTVTVNTTGTIEGAVEVSATLNLQAVENCLISYIAIEGNGQLFHNGLTTTIVKTVEVASSWETLSAPTEEGKAVFSTTAEKHDFYQYAEDAEMEWDYIGDMVSDNSYTMQAGRGYLYATNAEVSFEGTLNHETVTYPLSYTATQNLAGFHLIGNPFTHNISFAHLDGNIVEGYYVVGENNEFRAVEPTTSTEVIAPFQAVLVQATEAAGNLAINKEAAVEATREVSNGVLEIVASNGNYSDVAYVSFNEGYGLEKMAHNNANVPMVYLPVDNKNYAIAKYSNDVNEIPVSFIAKTMGEYTISVKAHDCAFESMYLTDRMTGERVNILMEDYTFVATSNDNAERFMLTFATTDVKEIMEESYIFISNDNLIINNINGNGFVRVVDMMGRIVAEYNVNESASISTSSMNSGVYVIQMSDDNGVKVQKVVIE